VILRFYWLILGILAVWRIGYLLTSEAGPWNSVGRMRQGLQKAFHTELVTCLYCMSIWIAAPLAFFIGDSWKERLVLWPALSAGAIVLERTIHREASTPLYYEDPEKPETQGKREDEHVLRQKSEPISIHRS